MLYPFQGKKKKKKKPKNRNTESTEDDEEKKKKKEKKEKKKKRKADVEGEYSDKTAKKIVEDDTTSEDSRKPPPVRRLKDPPRKQQEHIDSADKDELKLKRAKNAEDVLMDSLQQQQQEQQEQEQEQDEDGEIMPVEQLWENHLKSSAMTRAKIIEYIVSNLSPPEEYQFQKKELKTMNKKDLAELAAQKMPAKDHGFWQTIEVYDIQHD